MTGRIDEGDDWLDDDEDECFGQSKRERAESLDDYDTDNLAEAIEQVWNLRSLLSGPTIGMAQIEEDLAKLKEMAVEIVDNENDGMEPREKLGLLLDEVSSQATEICDTADNLFELVSELRVLVNKADEEEVEREDAAARDAPSPGAPESR